MCRASFISMLLLCATFAALLRAQDPPSGIEAVAAIEKVLVDVIARSEKSVVAIARVRKERPGETFQLDLRPDPFGRRPAPLASPQPGDPDFIPNEYGTGVVVDRRGLILTAYHVLGEDSDYYVTAADRNVYKASVKGADPRSDLAVLAVEGAANFPPIVFGNSADLKKGQIVITLGNPYAIARDGQVSAGWGIVSNLGRKAPAVPSESDPSGRPTLHHYGTLIQTDGKLNLGASGGPLLNLKGEMVGLAVALPVAAGYEAAAGYAYPVDATFRRVLETLKQGREVEYGFLGMLPGNLQASASSGEPRGVRVSQVVPGTPAARSGLKVNDVVTAVDDAPVYDSDGFYLNVGRLPAAAVTHMDYVRNGRKGSVEVTLAKYPVRGNKIVTVRPRAWRGLRADYPTVLVDALGRPLGGMSFVGDAVAVTEVLDGSPAWQAGLRRGTLISQVDHVVVRTPKAFAAAVAAKSGPVQLTVLGDDKNPLRTVQPGP
jgi:S1-C subfamily serine protease